MQKKLLTFFILTYINFEGIFDTLECVFNQDYPEIELIISDDGSPNYYEEIEKVKQYIDENKTRNILAVKYLHLEKNQGTVCNVNNVLRHANGEFIKGLGGADTLSCRSALSKYIDYLEKNDCQIVFAKLEGVTENGENIKYLASCEDDYSKLANMSPQELCDLLYSRNCLPAPAWCARKKLFDENGMYLSVTRLIEDYPYWIYLCRRNVKFGFMDEVLVKYRMNGISSAGNYSISFMEDMFIIYEQCIFPYDQRFGVMQPIYNKLKRMGLEAYYTKAQWKKYTWIQKVNSYIKYGVFYVYIFVNRKKIERKNKKYLKKNTIYKGKVK